VEVGGMDRAGSRPALTRPHRTRPPAGQLSGGWALIVSAYQSKDRLGIRASVS
jgi:hypothetical protein